MKCGNLKFGAETFKLSLLCRKFKNPLYFGVLPVIEHRTVRVSVSSILTQGLKYKHEPRDIRGVFGK